MASKGGGSLNIHTAAGNNAACMNKKLREAAEAFTTIRASVIHLQKAHNEALNSNICVALKFSRQCTQQAPP